MLRTWEIPPLFPIPPMLIPLRGKRIPRVPNSPVLRTKEIGHSPTVAGEFPMTSSSGESRPPAPAALIPLRGTRFAFAPGGRGIPQCFALGRFPHFIVG